MHEPIRSMFRKVWRNSGVSAGARAVPEETPVALSYNGGTYAVMMATPRDLDDFAVGFSLGEGIVDSAAEIRSLELVELPDGIELRMWLADDRADRLGARRRHVAGPTGCGLCGVESIAEALRPVAVVGVDAHYAPSQIMAAMQQLSPRQPLNIETRAVHAAAFWTPALGIAALCEDVGRHNALDKLRGAIVRAGLAPADGIVLLTSRVSVEMVQKTASLGAPLLVSVSAPTALAIRMAEAAGLTLCAIARADGFEVFTHPGRIALGDAADVA